MGTIKLIKSTRISDGILRLYFVAGENALKKLNEEAAILYQLTHGLKILVHVSLSLSWQISYANNFRLGCNTARDPENS